MAQDSQSIIEFRSADMEAAQFVNATRGKRSKRPRPGFSVLSASEEEEQSFSSSLSEDEEEDEEQQLAAYSLIMIAHARSCFPSSPFHSTAVKSALPSDAKMNKPKELHQESEKRYKCKTCNKKFFSFQALGGHRASCHKIKSVHSGGFDHQIIDNGVGSSSKDSQNLGVKFHECPICFRVFTSGQALGGHKRSHTSSSTANHSPSPAKAEELQLDLNMPAVIDADGTETEEDHSAFSCTVTPPHYEKPNYKFNPYWWMEGSERSTPSQDLGFKQDLFFVASVN